MGVISLASRSIFPLDPPREVPVCKIISPESPVPANLFPDSNAVSAVAVTFASELSAVSNVVFIADVANCP